MFDGEAVVVLGIGIGGEAIGTVAGKFCVVGDLLRGCAACDKMVRDGSRALFLSTLVFLLEDLGCPAVEAGTPGRGDVLVEMRDQERVPELVGDARARAFFCEHT